MEYSGDDSYEFDLFELFNRHQVEYLVIGGSAVAFYGFYRPSKKANGTDEDLHDFDFWYNPSYDNFYRLLNALEEIGVDVKAYRDDPQPDPRKSVFKLRFNAYKLDILPTLKAPIKFGEAFNRKRVFNSDAIAIPVISVGDLIREKEALNRAKDQEDIAYLKRLLTATDS